MKPGSIQLPIIKRYSCDVLVAGGGVAGISAACSAARNGASVILAERDGCLGGTATVGLVGPFMSAFDPQGKRQVIRGFMDEWVARMVEKGGAIPPEDCHGGDGYSAFRIKGHIGVTPFDPECLKQTAEELCEHYHVKLLYHMLLVSCESDNGRVSKAFFATKNGIYEICAKAYIDCTGDADLAVAAGAETVYGDENGRTQVASIFFMIDGVNRDRLEAFVERHPEETEKRQRYLEDIVEKAIADGTFPCGRSRVSAFESVNGIWRVNMTQYDEPANLVDPEDVTAAEIACRRQIQPLMAFLREHVPGFEHIRLLCSANALGIRESRRIVGEYTLSIEDMAEGAKFEDGICTVGSAVDFHGTARPDGSYDGAYYVSGDACAEIPFRCLLPRKTVNLAVAGRCLSADQLAHSAVRVMPPCIAMGQAAGTAAAMSVRNGRDFRQLDTQALQAQLIADGVVFEEG